MSVINNLCSKILGENLQTVLKNDRFCVAIFWGARTADHALQSSYS